MSNYWLERTKTRLDYSERIGYDAMKKILPIYEQALQNINKDINRLYVNYANKAGLDVMELTKILSGADREHFITSIQAKMRMLGFNIGDVYDPAYIGRLTRLEAMKQQIYWEIQSIAPRELGISEKAYSRIIEESYSSSRKDIREYLGKDYRGFSQINEFMKFQMLRENWQGGNYSTRRWANNSILNSRIQDVLPKVIGGGLVSGISQEKMQRQIREYFDVSRYNAMRLVRTETNYFTNQAELQSYKDEGVEYYRYEAILDERTSDICRELDGNVFKVMEARVGINYPPMHPQCRSDTTIVFNEEAKKEKVWTQAEWIEEHREKPKENDLTKDLFETQMRGLEQEGWKRR
jgi:SPP1 gp7 family putative phage head morphogenesis protein